MSNNIDDVQYWKWLIKSDGESSISVALPGIIRSPIDKLSAAGIIGDYLHGLDYKWLVYSEIPSTLGFHVEMSSAIPNGAQNLRGRKPPERHLSEM